MNERPQREREGWAAPDPALVKQALAVLMDEVADELWFCDRDGNLAMANKAAVAALGFEDIREVVQPMSDWLSGLEIFDAEDRPRLPEDAPLLRSLRGEIITNFEEIVRHPKTGRMLYREVYSTPIRDAAGETLGSVAVVRDVTERREMEERQKVLLGELQHRVKNMLANVQAIIGRMCDRHDSLGAIRSAVEERLQSLSRTQALLTREGAQRARIGDLLAAELETAALGEVEAEGPPVWLDPNAAQLLGMAFHEMVTNAAKHGVGRHGGAIAVLWRVDREEAGAETVALEWRERIAAGARTAPSGQTGFGTELIERALPYTLRGTSKLELSPDGARWSLRFPVGR